MSLSDWMRFLFKPRSIPLSLAYVVHLCEFSARNPEHDIHDYHIQAGGDGYPSHMYEYTCHNCREKFGI